MKFKIANATKLQMEVSTDAIPAKITKPAWAAKFKFFTNSFEGTYRLTEATTGSAVPGSYAPSRKEALKSGIETLHRVQPSQMRAAIKAGRERIASWK